MFKIGLDPYASIGLTENPFKVQALQPDEQGRRLLVGRDKSLRNASGFSAPAQARKDHMP